MTNDTRSPQEIERDIEAQRSDLTNNLERLQDKISIDSIVREVGDQFRTHGGDIGRALSDQIKANPIPLALTGIGLSWLMFGNGQKPSGRARLPQYRDDDVYSDTYSDAELEYRQARRTSGRPYVAPTAYATTRPTNPTWAQDENYDDYDYDDYDDGTSVKDRVAAGAASARDSAAGGAAAVKSGASSAAGSVADTARGVASSVSSSASAAGSRMSHAASSARSSMSEAAASARQGIASAGSRISHGTEHLTEEGRKRVIMARQKAIDVSRQTRRSAQQGADAAVDFYDRQPPVVGALALAVGAAIGGALPRTKTEDDFMGAKSDELFDQAERIYQEEMAKAKSVGESVKDEAQSIASDAKSDIDSTAPGHKTAAQAVSDEAKSAATRLSDAAKDAAQDEKLGKPNT